MLDSHDDGNFRNLSAEFGIPSESNVHFTYLKEYEF